MRLYRRPHLKFLNVIFTNANFLSAYIWVVMFSYFGGNSIFVVLDKINSPPDLKDMGKCQNSGEGDKNRLRRFCFNTVKALQNKPSVPKAFGRNGCKIIYHFPFFRRRWKMILVILFITKQFFINHKNHSNQHLLIFLSKMKYEPFFIL